MAGFNSTQLAATVAASNISTFIVPAPQSSPIYAALVKQFDCLNNKSATLDVPAWGARPDVVVLAEGGTATAANYVATAKVQIVAGMLDTTADITDQVIQDSTLMQSDMVNEMFENLYDTLDKEGLELFKGATNTSDHTGENLTLALWFADRALFKAQKPRGQMCYVGSGNQVRDIQLEMVQGAGGQQVSGAGNSIFASSVIDGYLGMYHGVAIFESGNVAENDASNDVGGFIGIVGSMSDDGRTANIDFSGFGMATWQPAQSAALYIPKKHAFETTVSARVGFRRIAEYMVRGVISKKAA